MERNVYKLQNRKYAGILFTAPFELCMDFNTDENSKRNLNAFVLVPNSADKTWYILTKMSGSKKALSIWRHKSRHCMPTGSKPIKDYECANEMTRNYVGISPYNAQIDQKWILQEVDGR